MASSIAPNVESPMIFFVPGAWHNSWAFDLVRDILTTRGFETAATELRTVGTQDSSIGLQDDAAHVRSVLTDLVDSGKEFLVVAHSYGGLVTSNAVQGLDIKQRPAGSSKGGIVMILWLAAFAVPNGTALIHGLGGKHAWWWDAHEDGLMSVKSPVEVFYHDVDPSLAARAVSSLKTMPCRYVEDASSYEPWNEGFEVGYIFAEEDRALPIESQKAMFSQFPRGSFSATLASAHSPFLNQPDLVADAIESAMRFLSEKVSSE